MEATAFCPAHITGFFKAHLDDNQNALENFGSTGAGFSIKQGVTTRVKIDIKNNQESNFRITTKGYQSDKTDVSEFVLNEFLKLGKFSNKFFDIEHKISIPVGYGLGSSGAVALSLSFALDQALETKLNKTFIIVTHEKEIFGDVDRVITIKDGKAFEGDQPSEMEVLA